MTEQTTTGITSSKILLLIAGSLIFAYTATRAMLLSITWDEAYSYLEFVRNGIVFPESFHEMSANNHLLNTFLSILLTKLAGTGEFVLRIPALAGHVLFLWFSARLIAGFQKKWLILASFLLLNLNPYMLDFFSLARGYGLSLGLMMASIYFFYQFTQGGKEKDSAVSIIFSALSVLANLVLLNYFLALFGTIVLLVLTRCFSKQEAITNKRTFLLKQLSRPVLIAAGLFAITLPFAIQLKEAGALFFGGSESFWKDTIGTVIDRSFYELGYNYWFQRLAKGFMILVLISAAAYAGYLRLKKKEKEFSFFALMLLILSVSAISTIVQHHVFDTLFLLDRTSLFLVVMFNIALVFFIAEVSQKFRLAEWLSYIASSAVVFHFIAAFNLSYVLEWKFDSNTKSMLKDLEKISTVPAGRFNISVGMPFWFEPAVNYYRDVNNLTWLNATVKMGEEDLLYDYYYLQPTDSLLQNNNLLEIIKSYPVTGNVLARIPGNFREMKKRLAKRLEFNDLPEKNFIVTEAMEFSPGFSYTISDSITPREPAIVQMKGRIKTKNLQCARTALVISVQRGETLIKWQNALLGDFINQADTWTEVVFSSIVPSEVQPGDEIKAYIWNPDKQEVSVDEMQLEWISYSK